MQTTTFFIISTIVLAIIAMYQFLCHSKAIDDLQLSEERSAHAIAEKVKLEIANTKLKAVKDDLAHQLKIINDYSKSLQLKYAELSKEAINTGVIRGANGRFGSPDDKPNKPVVTKKLQVV